jgi:hypothetical protein
MSNYHHPSSTIISPIILTNSSSSISIWKQHAKISLSSPIFGYHTLASFIPRLLSQIRALTLTPTSGTAAWVIILTESWFWVERNKVWFLGFPFSWNQFKNPNSSSLFFWSCMYANHLREWLKEAVSIMGLRIKLQLKQTEPFLEVSWRSLSELILSPRRA